MRNEAGQHGGEIVTAAPSIIRANDRISVTAAWLLSLVVAILLLPVGIVLRNTMAGTPAAGAFAVTPDALSDSVAAIAAEFRVDESGAATYSIPLFAAPGVAGVVPQMSLRYSSQGASGALGKGWAIGGLSAITRCRTTRESGDFIVGGVATDGNPVPINYTATDRYCLDGQRLLPTAAEAAGACTAVSGMTVERMSTEVQSHQRICAYTPAVATAGVAFFTVERVDGSISWYGDRDNNVTANRADGYVNATAAGKTAFALSWAQTRFQDSTGNYIDYNYHEALDSAVGEHLLATVAYTGRTALSGQVTSSQPPFAQISFVYQTRPATEQAKGYAAGGQVTQAHRLVAVRSESDGAQLRHYRLDYAPSASGSGMDTLVAVQECRDATQAVCVAPTTFAWSQARAEFSTKEYPANLPFGSIEKWRGFKQGDVDGDGRQDIVYIKEGSAGEACPSEYIYTAFSVLDASGRPSYVQGPTQCTTPAGSLGISGRGDGGWQLLDYNGDGRDDLFISSPVGQGWRLFLSTGRGAAKVFDDTNNVIGALLPIIPSTDDKNRQVQRADLNGDGLPDIVYDSGGMKTRLMERQGAGFVFGAERSLVLQSSIPCTICFSRKVTNWPDVGAMQVHDLNGDGSSDLLMQTELNKELAGDGNFRNEWYLEAYRVAEVTTTSIRLVTHGYWLDRYYQRQNGLVSSYDYIVQPKFADINGDGLTDLLLKDTGGLWNYRLNTGLAFVAPISLGTISYDQHMQPVDINGDGRADIAYVNTAYSNSVETGKKYFARLALPDGTISSSSVEIGGNAFLCEGYNCDPLQKLPIFMDADADGNLDFMSLRLSNNPDLFISRAADRFVPRDVIVKITNGYGAETDIAYAPLALKDFYRPDTGTLNSAVWGRGSPVFDLLVPTYAVKQVSSTSVQGGDPAAKSTLHYRYSGAKMQSGGRGFLGFRELRTIDPNQSGGYVTTTTLYSQNFPYVGLPAQTVKHAAIGMVYVPSACLTATPVDACFAPRGGGLGAVVGTGFLQSNQVWEAIAEAGTGFQPGIQSSVLPVTAGTQELVADPYTATQTSWAATAFTYGSHGNVIQTVLDSYSGTSTTPASTVITSNTFVDDVTRWRLGRLTASTVTHKRPGKTDVVRATSFAYAMSGAGTGLLEEERVQPGGSALQDLRKAYTLDDYGNRVASYLCNNAVTTCRSNVSYYNMWDYTHLHRYSRQQYDARGRYPTRSIELLRPSNAPDVFTTLPVEKVTAEVLERDAFGNVTEAVDINGVRAVARFGTLGRPYYAWKQSDPAGTVPDIGGTVGITGITTYRWCNVGAGAVTCPARARFRSKTVATSAPTLWTYHDALGREVLKVSQTFNAGITGKDAAGVCTEYDAVGRAHRVSTPFFVSGTTGGEPEGVASVCGTAGHNWSKTEFDVLGRPVKVTAPDLSFSTMAYSGRTTTATDARGHTKVEIKNGLGELVQVNDNAGLVTSYAYNAAGNLTSVSRDAGRGAIVTSMTYDALGRKVSMTDPDAGFRDYTYNAAGELLSETDGAGSWNESRYDFRGRVTWRGSYAHAVGGPILEHSSVTDYDTAPNGAGQERCTWSDPFAYAAWQGQSGMTQVWARCNAYDAMGRAIAGSTSIDGVTYTSAAVLDGLGRARLAQDPSGKWLKTDFGSRGHALRICEGASGSDTAACAPGAASTYYEAHAADAFGNIVHDTRGGSVAMQSFRQYDPLTGRLTETCAGADAANCQIMRDRYVWDAVGNLSWRDRKDYAEQFAYDSVDRLVYSQATRIGATTYSGTAGPITDWFHYDKLGNICGKALPGSASAGLFYAGRAGCGLVSGEQGGIDNASAIQSPHQVLLAGNNRYTYDAHGNQTFADSALGDSHDRTIRYTASDQAHEIFKGPAAAPMRRARFWYDPSGARYKREDNGSGIVGTRRTVYVGNLEIVSENGTTTYKRYIGGVLVQNVVGGIAANRYLFQDHQGSVVKATNEAGTVLEGSGFNAFGERRVNGSATALTTTGLSSTNRGYTGHEMLDGLDVIHMNGRIYDPTLGRFLQPDPVIQAPDNPQNWNAYTYVFNNPHRYTDPTGMMGIEERKWLSGIIAVVAAIFQQYYISIGAWGAAFGVAVIGGFASSYVATGTLRGGVLGAFGAALTVGITGMNLGPYAEILMRGLSGGIMDVLGGGNFGNGFFGAALGAGVSIGMGRLPITSAVGKIVARAIAGGTASVATGGKFANGALQSLFQSSLSVRVKSESFEATAQSDVKDFSDAPDEALRSLLKNPKTFESGLKKIISGRYGEDVADDVTYIDGISVQRMGSYGGFRSRPLVAADVSQRWFFMDPDITFYRRSFEGGSYYDLLSIIDHEVFHYFVRETNGHESMTRAQNELYAMAFQRSRPEWGQTTQRFKNAMATYQAACMAGSCEVE